MASAVFAPNIISVESLIVFFFVSSQIETLQWKIERWFSDSFLGISNWCEYGIIRINVNQTDFGYRISKSQLICLFRARNSLQHFQECAKKTEHLLLAYTEIPLCDGCQIRESACSCWSGHMTIRNIIIYSTNDVCSIDMRKWAKTRKGQHRPKAIRNPRNLLLFVRARSAALGQFSVVFFFFGLKNKWFKHF